MTIAFPSLDHVSDADLLARVGCAAQHERHSTAQLIALLMEVDARRLYLAEGCSSLFTYCMQVLHLTEHAAYGRIEAARAARKFPVVLERIADGTLSLTAVGLLAPHLTPDNYVTVLDAARHKTKNEVLQLVARLKPKPDVPPAIRKLPAPKAPPSAAHTMAGEANCDSAPAQPMPQTVATPSHRAEVKPLAPERFKIQLTVSRKTHDKLRRVQDLLRHSVPNGDLETIFDKALTLLIEHTERTKLAATHRPRSNRDHVSGKRHVPAAVKRAVWARDGGQCAFRGAQGRCRETGFLEFHHVIPYAAGGETSVENLELRCRPHNAYEAEQRFGMGKLPLVRECREVYG
jgi:hypothetical protein